MNKSLIHIALAGALTTAPFISALANEMKANEITAKFNQQPAHISAQMLKTSDLLTRHKRKADGHGVDNQVRSTRVWARDAYLAISDSNLRNCVQSKVTQMGITFADELNQLFCSNRQIQSLAGIEPFTNLSFIDFGFNNISDITPLANLTSLTHAMLWQNQISDISAVATWSSLYETDLTGNPITDVSALNGHPSLTRLFIGNSGYTISDLSPISSLSQLQWLGIFDNQLTDANFTLGMNSLELLDLHNNPVTDISALSQLGNLNELGLMFTMVADISPVLMLNNPFNWIGMYGASNVYCWQQDYAQNQPNISFYDASMSCDSSTDWDDFDSDGVPNTIEVSQGTDPFGPIVPPPPTNMTFIDALSQVSDTQLHACLTNVHYQTPFTYANELTILNCSAQQITNINGIENFESLTELSLANNFISDINPLNTLSQLQILDLIDNQIVDIHTIGQLTNLTYVGLANNWLTDFTPLTNLPSLQVLDIADTTLTDASVLASLTSLTDLDVTNTGLTDASPLAALTNLNRVMMDFNTISDVSAVLQLNDNWQQLSFSEQTYCWQLDYVDLYATVNVWQRPQMCDYSDDFNDFDGDGMLNIDEVLMGTNPFTAGPPPVLSYDDALMQISDVGLYNCLLTAKQNHQMASDLTHAYCMGQGINNLNGIEQFNGLVHLDLGMNNLSDISPLSSLTNLQTLYFHTNSIVDISALSSLNQLTNLWAHENLISDISPLSTLSALQEAQLAFNPISDVSALSGLTSLTHVDLYQTAVLDLAGFENLTALQYIDISHTSISDISPLSNATNLEYMMVQNTQVFDVGPVIQLPNTWALLILADNTYCWQIEYIHNRVTVSNFTAPMCDNSEDFADFDNDGVSNFDEVIQGSNPWVFEVPPPPTTIFEGINALADANLANCIFNAEMPRLDDPIENLEMVMCFGQNIASLEGMANFTGLRTLDIMNNNVTSIEPLRGLNNLEVLISDDNPIASIDAVSELPALFDFGLNQSTVADVSLLFTVPNAWQVLTFSEHNYCWQINYAQNALTLVYIWVPPTCDSTDDFNDFDNDGIDNISEVNQGTSPFVAD